MAAELTKTSMRQMMLGKSSSKGQQKIIAMEHNELRYLLQQLIRNLTQEEDSIMTSAEENVTVIANNNTFMNLSNMGGNSSSLIENNPDRSDISLAIYLGLFFLWYGGIIYGCLIGMGVYNRRRKSATLYQTFVERNDIREELRKRKEQLVQHRRMQHRASCTSQQSIGSFNLVYYDHSPILNKPDSTASSIGEFQRRNSSYNMSSEWEKIYINRQAASTASVSDVDTNNGLWMKTAKLT